MLLLIPTFSKVERGCGWEKYLYDDIVFIVARGAGLGLGRPEVKPSTPESLPAWLRELAGKLRWMKWEPMSLAGGGCHSLQ